MFTWWNGDNGGGPVRERDFQGWIIEVAERYSWKVWHVGMPARQVGGGRLVPEPKGRGLPDLIMLHEDPPRLIFAEVKNETGRLSVEQKEFLRLARDVAEWSFNHGEGYVNERNIGVYSWRPGQEPLIEATLRVTA